MPLLVVPILPLPEAANLILPFHREMDEIREDAAGKGKIRRVFKSPRNKINYKFYFCRLILKNVSST
jgi:hypothetical protein